MNVLDKIVLSNGIFISIIMAFAELLKELGVNSKLIPVINVVLGIAGGVLFLNPFDYRMGALEGLVMGLTASGFYSSVKNIKEGIDTIK